MPFWAIMLIVIVILAGVLVALYFLGKKGGKETGRAAGADGGDQTDRIHVDYR